MQTAISIYKGRWKRVATLLQIFASGARRCEADSKWIFAYIRWPSLPWKWVEDVVSTSFLVCFLHALSRRPAHTLVFSHHISLPYPYPPTTHQRRKNIAVRLFPTHLLFLIMISKAIKSYVIIKYIVVSMYSIVYFFIVTTRQLNARYVQVWIVCYLDGSCFNVYDLVPE